MKKIFYLRRVLWIYGTILIILKSLDCLLLHITLPSSPARDFNFSSAEKTPSIVVVVGMLLISNLYGFIFILGFDLYFSCNVICFGSYPLVICGHDLFSYRRIGFSSVIWGNLWEWWCWGLRKSKIDSFGFLFFFFFFLWNKKFGVFVLIHGF